MNLEMLEEKIREALEADDPKIIENLINNTELGDHDWMGDESYLPGELISKCVEQRKPKIFTFLKKTFPESSGWVQQLQLIQIEYHKVQDFRSGELDDCNVSELFEVQEGSLVVKKNKLEELAQDVDFDKIGIYSPTAQNGGYPTEVYLADDEELVSYMDRYMIET